MTAALELDLWDLRQRPITVESTTVDGNMASGTSYRAVRRSGRHIWLQLSCSGVSTAS